MKQAKLKRVLCGLLCSMLIAATAFATTGCSNTATSSSSETVSSSLSSSTSASETNELGEGATQFLFTVTDADGKQTDFTINTDETTVGAALLGVDLIAGEDSEYGLYVKTVNGITLDYDADGMYWAFYVDGEYASTGVDSTEVTAGASYEFKAEKG